MTKIERLSNLTGMSIDTIEREIDSGMIDILIILNEKNYKTSACCEGHLREDNTWDGYIGCAHPYDFVVYPMNFTSVKNRIYYYWNGKGEESRQEFLHNLYDWALNLPVREMVEIKNWTMYIKNKRRPNSREKILKSSNNYEDIRVLFNRADMYKYNIRIDERVVQRY